MVMVNLMVMVGVGMGVGERRGVRVCERGRHEL